MHVAEAGMHGLCLSRRLLRLLIHDKETETGLVDIGSGSEDGWIAI